MFFFLRAHTLRSKSEEPFQKKKRSGAKFRSSASRALCDAQQHSDNALESERKEHTVEPFEHTPQHLYDVDDPCFGFAESSASNGSYSCGDWGDYDHDSS